MYMHAHTCTKIHTQTSLESMKVWAAIKSQRTIHFVEMQKSEHSIIIYIYMYSSYLLSASLKWT